MRCAKAKHLMHFTRSGELDDAILRKLREHLRTCTGCSAEKAALDRSAGLIESVRNAAPVLDDPAALTQAIMRRVDAERMQRVRPASTVFAPMSFDRLRAVCTAAALLIVVAFFLQSYDDARGLESLETRLGRSAQRSNMDSNLTAQELQSAAEAAGHLDSMSPRQAAAVATEFGTAFTVIRTTSLGTTPEMERLRAKYPRLWTLTLDRGLDDRTRKILATDGRAFLKEVQDLIDLGGQ